MPAPDNALPGPPCPWWGMPLLRAMWRDYLGVCTELQRRHGDVVAMRLGRERVVDLYAPELVRGLLVDHADSLIRWERGTAVLAQSMGQSVLVTEGATWQRQRRMLMPAFTPRRVAGYAQLMVQAARAGLDSALPACRADGPVDMDLLFTRMAMDVILGTLFGQAVGDRTRDATSAAAAQALQVLSRTAIREMFWPVTLPDWLPLPGKAAKRRALALLDDMVGGHIARRRAALARSTDAGAEPGDDLLGRLIALRDDASGLPLSAAELRDQCMVTFQAGHETTATALLWWSLLMARYPEVAERAHAEIDAVLRGRDPGPDDLPALPWLDATLKEAMRLYPPVAALMSRRTTRDITLGPWRIPRGSMVRLATWVLHHDARWFPEPEAFRPERFLPGAPEIPRGAYLPFGAGPRVCLGQHFATLEMTLLAAMLLQRFTLTVPAGAPPLVPQLAVTLRPRGAQVLRLARRAAAPTEDDHQAARKAQREGEAASSPATRMM